MILYGKFAINVIKFDKPFLYKFEIRNGFPFSFRETIEENETEKGFVCKRLTKRLTLKKSTIICWSAFFLLILQINN